MQTHSTASENTKTADRILRPRELAERIGLSLATLWRLRRRGDLPEPIRLSPGCVGWRASEIDAWLTERAERRI
jgi:prophage regulatory protein